MRQWFFRAAAVALGLAFVLAAEGVLRFLGVAGPPIEDDPFVDFREVKPLFELDESGRYYQTATARTNYFVRDRFTQQKAERTFRVFVLGGSTVQGRPWSIETAFPRWIQLLLQARFPEWRFEIVNCGGVSYASYRLTPILEECLELYEPDAIVLCTGHNEFLEERTYRSPTDFGGLLQSVSSWRLARLLGSLVKRTDEVSYTGAPRAVLPAEVDALLDYRGGLEAYRRDDSWRGDVLQHFEFNLRRMAGLCREAEVPLMILSPPVNVRSSPPFKSVLRPDLTAEKRLRWEELSARAKELYASDPREAIRLLLEAIDLDDDHAHVYFVLGVLLESIGRPENARTAYLLAKELDVCPLRILESQRRALHDTASVYGLPSIDLQDLLEEQSDYCALGSEIMVDHVHPTITGHQLIAEAVVNQMAAENWLPAASGDGSSDHRRLFAEHLASLDARYFAHGQLRLENLRLWTQGRTDGLPLDQRNSAAE